jgi:TolA-binding protein
MTTSKLARLLAVALALVFVSVMAISGISVAQEPAATDNQNRRITPSASPVPAVDEPSIAERIAELENRIERLEQTIQNLNDLNAQMNQQLKDSGQAIRKELAQKIDKEFLADRSRLTNAELLFKKHTHRIKGFQVIDRQFRIKSDFELTTTPVN